MKGYRKVTSECVTIDELAMSEEGDAENPDEDMRGILGKILEHAQNTGIMEYRIVVYAKSLRTPTQEHP